ncbi:ribosomal protein S21 [Sphingomonas faeni]|nr:ribosomal protein S21 [Sphingomonas faeni]
MQIIVRDNNVDQGLRALKKKLQREGVYREMKLRRHYEKPSEKRAREHAAAVSRARKADGAFYRRRDLGGRYELELHRTPVDLLVKPVRLVGTLVGPALVNAEGVTPA